MNEAAKTSVIIPVHNGENFIAEALESVLSQLSPSDEILVVDDASTDGTRALLQQFGERVTVLTAQGKGPSAARNLGIAAARGDFIAFLDHDDVWPAGRHQALLASLKSDEAVDAVAGRILIRFDDDAQKHLYLALHGRHTPSILMTCLYRRRIIDKAGLFDEDMRFGEDLNYYVRLAECGMTLRECDQDSLIYRRHDRNATNSAPPSNSVLLNILARKLARHDGATRKGS